MRSIEYFLGGRPRNLDDCLDFSSKNFLRGINVSSITKEEVYETYTLKKLICIFKWEFNKCKVVYEELYGGCLAIESEERQRKSVDNANKRLKATLKEIDSNNLRVDGKVNMFDYSLIYQDPSKM